MHYYLALTSNCNLMCKYCYGKTTEDFLDDESVKKYELELPDEINFDVEELAKYSKDDDEFILTFYGGEPLLKRDLIYEIMDKIDNAEFMLQTNGIFLDKLDFNYLNRLSTILVSIDGTKEHTNERRGKGVYDKVVSNLKNISNKGFSGEIIARMTVDETCDIFENVTYLLTNDDFKFKSVHWQIDAQFWEEDFKQRNFNDWAIFNYNPKIVELIDWWVLEMKKKGKVHKIYPFLGVLDAIRNKRKIRMHCGAGHSVLGIQTNGKIVACPITAGYKPFYMGDVRTSSLKDVKENKIVPSNLCEKCEILDICSGRCLYANKTMLWGEKGFKDVCDTVFFLVNTLKRKRKDIEELIEKGVVCEKDFDFRRYNGVEIIP